MDQSKDNGAPASIVALVAYLALLDSTWEELTDREKRDGVRLALQAARRAAVASRKGAASDGHDD